MNGRANIIEGGCYQPHGGGGPKIVRKYLIIAVIIEIVAIVLTIYRFLWSKL